MNNTLRYRLARYSDAQAIALMSRQYVEAGLGWSWRRERVLRHLRSRDTVTVAATTDHALTGFAIMQFTEHEGHLKLLAVDPDWRRRGVGQGLMSWLEHTALIAGTPLIYLEMRADNHVALRFYQALGYRVFARVRGYYGAREDALRLGKDLWSGPQPAGAAPG